MTVSVNKEILFIISFYIGFLFAVSFKGVPLTGILFLNSVFLCGGLFCYYKAIQEIKLGLMKGKLGMEEERKKHARVSILLVVTGVFMNIAAVLPPHY